jgi:hypothetical protein
VRIEHPITIQFLQSCLDYGTTVVNLSDDEQFQLNDDVATRVLFLATVLGLEYCELHNNRPISD